MDQRYSSRTGLGVVHHSKDRRFIVEFVGFSKPSEVDNIISILANDAPYCTLVSNFGGFASVEWLEAKCIRLDGHVRTGGHWLSPKCGTELLKFWKNTPVPTFRNILVLLGVWPGTAVNSHGYETPATLAEALLGDSVRSIEVEDGLDEALSFYFGEEIKDQFNRLYDRMLPKEGRITGTAPAKALQRLLGLPAV